MPNHITDNFPIEKFIIPEGTPDFWEMFSDFLVSQADTQKFPIVVQILREISDPEKMKKLISEISDLADYRHEIALDCLDPETDFSVTKDGWNFD